MINESLTEVNTHLAALTDAMKARKPWYCNWISSGKVINRTKLVSAPKSQGYTDLQPVRSGRTQPATAGLEPRALQQNPTRRQLQRPGNNLMQPRAGSLLMQGIAVDVTQCRGRHFMGGGEVRPMKSWSANSPAR
jgi:hypothetical protein